jgi:hypothetical protein
MRSRNGSWADPGRLEPVREAAERPGGARAQWEADVGGTGDRAAAGAGRTVRGCAAGRNARGCAARRRSGPDAPRIRRRPPLGSRPLELLLHGVPHEQRCNWKVEHRHRSFESFQQRAAASVPETIQNQTRRTCETWPACGPGVNTLVAYIDVSAGTPCGRRALSARNGPRRAEAPPGRGGSMSSAPVRPTSLSAAVSPRAPGGAQSASCSRTPRAPPRSTEAATQTGQAVPLEIEHRLGGHIRPSRNSRRT